MAHKVVNLLEHKQATLNFLIKSTCTELSELVSPPMGP